FGSWIPCGKKRRNLRRHAAAPEERESVFDEERNKSTRELMVPVPRHALLRRRVRRNQDRAEVGECAGRFPQRQQGDCPDGAVHNFANPPFESEKWAAAPASR